MPAQNPNDKKQDRAFAEEWVRRSEERKARFTADFLTPSSEQEASQILRGLYSRVSLDLRRRELDLWKRFGFDPCKHWQKYYDTGVSEKVTLVLLSQEFLDAWGEYEEVHARFFCLEMARECNLSEMEKCRLFSKMLTETADWLFNEWMFAMADAHSIFEVPDFLPGVVNSLISLGCMPGDKNGKIVKFKGNRLRNALDQMPGTSSPAAKLWEELQSVVYEQLEKREPGQGIEELVGKVDYAICKAQGMSSLNAPICEGADETFMDMLAEPEDPFEDVENRVAVQEELNRIRAGTPQERLAWILRVHETGLVTVQQIADALQENPRTIEQRLYRHRKKQAS